MEREAPAGMLWQAPYLFQGSLVEQLTYPAKFLRHLPAHQPPQTGLRLTEELADSLAQVGLSHLPKRAGGWHETVDWPSTLSGGERQRLALARLLRSRCHALPRGSPRNLWHPL